MSISYENLFKILDKRGLSINALSQKHKIIPDSAGRRIREGKPVSLKHINAICVYLKVPIEEVVRIEYDETSPRK